jgi:hypothetical protein
MSDIIKDIPAFPCPDERGPDGYLYYPACHGLSKRELFAALAMQVLCARIGNDAYPGESAGYGTLDEWRKNINQQEAAYCVRMADALLAELEKEKI